LDNGAYVDSLNKDGNTPLFCAVEKVSSSCVKVKKIKEFFSNNLFSIRLAFIGIWCGYNNY
jgi:hypothetical protein